MTRIESNLRHLALCCVVVLLAACGESGGDGDPSGAGADAAVADATLADGSVDSGAALDSGSADTGAVDAGPACKDDASCDDGNPCTDDTCDAAKGCLHSDNTLSCDDGNACTTGEVCKAGACGLGTGKDCVDGNPCTDDSCDPAKGCVHPSNTAPCSDGDVCSIADACKDGKCAGGAPQKCDDGNPCTDNSCDAAKGCVALPNKATCTDNNPCTAGDACAAGVCKPAKQADCDDKNPCTTEVCDLSSGCTQTANTAACSDGNFCTQADACKGGKCTGGGAVNCDDKNACTLDTCDPKKGCASTATTGTCTDGNPCTTGDACTAGACKAKASADCDDKNPCTKDSCSLTKGCQNTAQDGLCSDGDKCTTNDSCKAGKCAGGDKLVCKDSNPCTNHSCDKDKGCVQSAHVGSCDDGDACTTGDSCKGISCEGKAKTCSDGNDCTADSCDTKSGNCVFTATTAQCGAATKCTAASMCKDKKCVASSPKDCSDSNVCTTDTCDLKTGCVHAATDALCDDGNKCSVADCTTGSCKTAKAPWRIDTWVGAHTNHRDGPRAQAKFNYLTGVAVDGLGQVWISDRDNHMVRRVDTKGVVSTAGGDGVPGFRNGPASVARFHNPGGLETDAKGQILVADFNNYRVRRIGLNGMVSTFAGSGLRGSADGPATTAKFMGPYDVAVGPKGNAFVGDLHTVRKITESGMVTTFASKAINDVRGLDVDSKGNVWMVSTLSLRVYRISPTGVAQWMSGFGFGKSDGYGTSDNTTAKYYYPDSIMVDKQDKVWIVDTYNHRIRLMTDTKIGKVTTVAGSVRGHLDGAMKSAKFDYPTAIALDKKTGAMYVTQRSSDLVRKIDKGQVSTWAGQPHVMHKDAKGTAARFGFPRANTVDSKGNVYVADMFQHTIRKVGAEGTVTTVAGKAGVSGSADGKGTAATFNYPYGIGVDAKDVLYVSERHGHRIRKITADGSTSTLAGSTSGFADGKGAAAKFKLPRGIAVAADGVVFVADTNNHRIRKVAVDGTVTTVAGSAFGNADGVGALAKFNSPYDLALGPKGDLWVAGTGNPSIRRVTQSGVVTTFAGGTKVGTVDGIGKDALFKGPLGIAVAANGTIYVADGGAIRMVTPSAVVTTLLGTSSSLLSVDGAAPLARLIQPTGLTIRADGALIVSDSKARSIGIVKVGAPVTPDCSDGDGCTLDACNATNGCTHTELSSGMGNCYSGPEGTLHVGVCSGGTRTCGGNKVCQGEVVPAKVDICGNGLDDDCDGHADNGCLVLASIAGEYSYSCGLTSKGAPVCWGFALNEVGMLPQGPFTQIAVGRNHACALNSAGQITCWGEGDKGQLKVPTGTFKSVSAGTNHTCGLRTNGQAVCWGDNSQQQTKTVSIAFKQIYSAQYGNCGIRSSDGSLYCWGSKPGGKLPTGSFESIALNAQHACGLRTNGTVACWGSSGWYANTPTTGKFKRVTAGGLHTCAIDMADKVVCWGTPPGHIVGLTTAPSGLYKEIAAGRQHTCALRMDGRVRCWGMPTEGGDMLPPGGLKP